jgi:hypothetical protein
MKIADREQDKSGVLQVSVQTVLYHWSKSLNISPDGWVAINGWNGRERKAGTCVSWTRLQESAGNKRRCIR